MVRWLWLLPMTAAALIDVSMKPAVREIPPGHVARWMWQGPGRVQLNASCRDGQLDFYVVSGDQYQMRRKQRGHGGPMKDGGFFFSFLLWWGFRNLLGVWANPRPKKHLCNVQVGSSSHWISQDHPDCQSCSDFRLESTLPTVDSNVTMLIASNQDWTSEVILVVSTGAALRSFVVLIVYGWMMMDAFPCVFFFHDSSLSMDLEQFGCD